MDSIKIDEMRDVLIVEKCEGTTILEGSHVFCGCCGKSIGTLNQDLSFPFDSKLFLVCLKDSSVDAMLFGLRHKICGHTMFSFRKEYGFMSLLNYKREMAAHAH